MKLAFYQNPEKRNVTVSIKMWSITTVFNIIIRKDSWAENQHIIIISKGSCDTENWSYDAENTALITEINYILKYCILT